MAARIMYSGGIVTNGLILHLDAANRRSYPRTGTAWNNLNSNEHNGTLVNGVSYSDENSGIMVFDGTNDTVDCGPVSAIGASLTGLTVSMWLRTRSNSNSVLFLENGTNFTTNTFYLGQENPNNLTFLVYGEGSYDLAQISSPIPYPLNTWFNIVGMWQSGVRSKMFYNGIDRTQIRDGSIRTSVQNGNTNLFVGSRAGTSFYLEGNISQTLIYNRALSATEVQNNFNALRGRYGI